LLVRARLKIGGISSTEACYIRAMAGVLTPNTIMNVGKAIILWAHLPLI